MDKINEIVIISGKGGTGKTTIALSLVPLLEDVVTADCDVDAPDMDIILSRGKESCEDFCGNKKAYINEEKCIKCGKCLSSCKFNAISEKLAVKQNRCEGCGVCEIICPVSAIEMKKSKNGELYISNTDYGKLFHARLNPGEENSGLLVSRVRKNAKEYAKNNGKKNIIVDGAPGIACNVISSITGATRVIIVTEPTVAGLHDLERVYEVTQKFRLPVDVIINKSDISELMSKKIESFCAKKNIKNIINIPFDKRVVDAISNKEIPSIAVKDIFEKSGILTLAESISQAGTK